MVSIDIEEEYEKGEFEEKPQPSTMYPPDDYDTDLEVEDVLDGLDC